MLIEHLKFLSLITFRAAHSKSPMTLLQSSAVLTTTEISDQSRFPVEFLNSLSPSGLPPHQLNVKIGSAVILLRNLNPRRSLCNGTRLIVVKITHHLIKGRVVGHEHSNATVLIPRIDTTTEDDESPSVAWIRRQFPLQLAFAMTIKSQGQTFNRFGVYLEDSLFSLEQLYVALS